LDGIREKKAIHPENLGLRRFFPREDCQKGGTKFGNNSSQIGLEVE